MAARPQYRHQAPTARIGQTRTASHADAHLPARDRSRHPTNRRIPAGDPAPLHRIHHIPDDLHARIAKRLERQQVLYQGPRRFRIIIGEQALSTMVGGNHVMLGQMDRLPAAMRLPRITFGIIPAEAELPIQTTNFVIFDNRMVAAETVTAELTITQPLEIMDHPQPYSLIDFRAKPQG